MPPLKDIVLRAPAFDRAVSLLKHPRLLSTNFDYRSSIYLAGAGRSGTTWLSNIINYDGKYRDIFEPFDATYVSVAAPFFSGLYLRSTDDEYAYRDAATRILSGRVGNRRLDAANRRLFRRQRMIKEVRGNLWLKWLRNQFPGIPMVLLVRHPCAVAISRVQLDWATLIPQYLAQPKLMEDHLEPLRTHIEAARSPFEKHLFAWCIQHYVPLRQLAPGDVHVVFYENLCVDTPAEVQHLFAFLGRKGSEGALRRAAVPSFTNFRKTTIVRKSGEELTTGWTRHIDAEQLKSAMRILDLFGLDAIYGKDPLPRVRSLDGFFTKPTAT